MKTINLLLAILILIFLSSCSDSGDPIIPGPEFNQVSSYNEIPHDFVLTYDIRDEFAQPPYRLILTFERNGDLTYEKTISKNHTYDRVTEMAKLGEDDVLALYNYIISKGYFDLKPIYPICTSIVPVEMIEAYAKATTTRVQHQTCMSCNKSEYPPPEFRQIIDYLKQVASDLLHNM